MFFHCEDGYIKLSEAFSIIYLTIFSDSRVSKDYKGRIWLPRLSPLEDC